MRVPTIEDVYCDVRRLRSMGLDVIDMAIGTPGFSPPREALEYLSRLLLERRVEAYRYTESRGLERLRELVAETLRRLGGPSLSLNEVLVTNGATEGFFIIALALSRGGEAVVLEPCYPPHRRTLEMLGVRVRAVATSMEEGFQPDEEALKASVSRSTRLMVVTTPDNPTGRIIRRDIAKLIADLALDNDCWVVSDETYKYLVYEGTHTWMASLCWERTLVVNSFSKELSAPGLRLGYVYGPEDVVERLARVKECVSLCPPAVSQLFAAYCLEHKLLESHLDHVVPVYARRRDVLCRELSRISGVKVFKPSGGFFVFPNVSEALDRLGLDDVELSKTLLSSARVSVVPGSCFGEAGRGHVRLSFSLEDEHRIIEGVRRLARTLGH